MKEDIVFWLGVWYGLRRALAVESDRDSILKLKKLEEEVLERLELSITHSL